MQDIHNAQQAIERAKTDLADAVRKARAEGHTWAAIGETLGMSRQAAFKRFGEVLNPITGKNIQGAPVSLEQIIRETERVFTLISEGNTNELEALIHPDVRDQLSQAIIAETWNRVLADIGAMERFEDTHVVFPAGERIEEDTETLGTVVGVTLIHCEAGELMGRVAFDEERRIVGLFLVDPEHSPLPF